MTDTDPSNAPQNAVPLPLKILVYTLFVALVVAAIAVGTRFVARNSAQDAERKALETPWEVVVNEALGSDFGGGEIKSAALDGKVLTLIVSEEGKGDHVVLIDTKKGLIIGQVSLTAD